jgi:hypothetical protein
MEIKTFKNQSVKEHHVDRVNNFAYILLNNSNCFRLYFQENSVLIRHTRDNKNCNKIVITKTFSKETDIYLLIKDVDDYLLTMELLE